MLGQGFPKLFSAHGNSAFAKKSFSWKQKFGISVAA